MQVEAATGLPLQNAHISGNPIPWTPPNATAQTELFGVVHTRTSSFSYKHWAVRMSVETLAVTHISSKPIIESSNYKPAGYLKEALVVGSFHELKGSDGHRVRILSRRVPWLGLSR